MNLNPTPEEKAIGKDNFHAAVGSKLTRRDFLQASIAAGTVSGVGLGAMYFGYEKIKGDPVRVGLIGTGDEGGILVGAHNPDYLRIIAIADIRPSNIERIFHGDPRARAARPGLLARYPEWSTEDQARKDVEVYDKDYHGLLANSDVEAVIIAVPLHLHAKIAIEAMRAGKHVLTEKLMAHSVTQCKEMARVAKETEKILATGHQRHYSVLYDNAMEIIRRGLIGDIHHIRAQWHRNGDRWIVEMPKDGKKLVKKWKKELKKTDLPAKRRAAVEKVLKTKGPYFEMLAKDVDVNAAGYGYQEHKLDKYGNPTDEPGKEGHHCTPMEELIRWRLWSRTGGGLMAELGSHQLDAASLFIKAMSEDGKEVHPLSVSAVGGRHVSPANRDIADHVYCSFEFPNPKHRDDPNKKIIVSYSAMDHNGFGGYGEVVMGTKGTLILVNEKDYMLFKGSSATQVGVKSSKDKIALDSYESTADVAVGQKALAGEISRGYTEEMEHWAWCIRSGDPDNQPRCNPEVALADAAIVLTANIAISQQQRIEFKPEWFDIENDATPEVEYKIAGSRSPDKDPKLSNYPKSVPG
ncbi:MAG: Gfo/Idh/MocA family oxidoreductase [Planctomycetes bacterium]|nr:Gfo/Idh/MocA family oxidoreductase [Planctomycetota bacterium]